MYQTYKNHIKTVRTVSNQMPHDRLCVAIPARPCWCSNCTIFKCTFCKVADTPPRLSERACICERFQLSASHVWRRRPRRQTGRQAYRQTDRQTDRRAGRQADRQSDKAFQGILNACCMFLKWCNSLISFFLFFTTRFGNFLTKLGVSRRFQPTIYLVFHEESESEVQNTQIL